MSNAFQDRIKREDAVRMGRAAAQSDHARNLGNRLETRVEYFGAAWGGDHPQKDTFAGAYTVEWESINSLKGKAQEARKEAALALEGLLDDISTEADEADVLVMNTWDGLNDGEIDIAGMLSDLHEVRKHLEELQERVVEARKRAKETGTFVALPLVRHKVNGLTVAEWDKLRPHPDPDPEPRAPADMTPRRRAAWTTGYDDGLHRRMRDPLPPNYDRDAYDLGWDAGTKHRAAQEAGKTGWRKPKREPSHTEDLTPDQERSYRYGFSDAVEGRPRAFTNAGIEPYEAGYRDGTRHRTYNQQAREES